MRKENKDLLLRDLCARLPYGVVCHVKYIINNETTDGEDVPAECDDKLLRVNFDHQAVYTEWLEEYSDICDVRPYLRPMSSMTEEESDDWVSVDSGESGVNDLDWLYQHYFDVRGLIEKGLALEAPEGMYDLNE